MKRPSLKQGRALNMLLGADSDAVLQAARDRLGLSIDLTLLARTRNVLQPILQALLEDDAPRLRQLLAALDPASGMATSPSLSAQQQAAFPETGMLEAATSDGPLPFLEDVPAIMPAHETLSAPQGDSRISHPLELTDVVSASPLPSKLPMSLDEYARLVAHTEQGGPAASGESRQRQHSDHGIGDDRHRTRVDNAFHKHFKRNPEALRAYQKALDQWRAKLRKPQ